MSNDEQWKYYMKKAAHAHLIRLKKERHDLSHQVGKLLWSIFFDDLSRDELQRECCRLFPAWQHAYDYSKDRLKKRFIN